MCPRHCRVAGVGVNDLAIQVVIDGMPTRVYTHWNSMLQRCYDARVQVRAPTYVGCTVHQRWHRLSEFKAWFDRNYVTGYQLDKDILIPGNKVYGPWTCAFVPGRINSLLVNCKATRIDLPLGVTLEDRRYRASCMDHTSKHKRKSFDSVDEAAAWYRETKSAVIRRVATDALARREISLRVHAGLFRHADLITHGGH